MVKNKRSFKKIVGYLHLWGGLLSGVIIFFVALTGTIFVIGDEAVDFIAGEAKYVEKGTVRKSPEELLAIFHQQNPTRKAFYIDSYKDPNRSFRVASTIGPMKQRKSMAYTYMNPYSGKILKTSQSYYFFFSVARLHKEILLKKTGKTIVGIACIIFVTGLIGGLILWCPKRWNKNTRAASFKIKSGTKWKRKNYDLHKVLGFYTIFPALLISLTGLVMAYDVLGNLVHKSFNGDANGDAPEKKYAPPYQEHQVPLAYTKILEKEFSKSNTIQQVRISLPKSDSATTLRVVSASFIGLKNHLNGESQLLNRYTGDKIDLPENIVNHEKIEDTVFDLHSGYWLGKTGKLVYVVVGLICTSLPVTGFLIWWGRRKKSSNKSTASLQK